MFRKCFHIFPENVARWMKKAVTFRWAVFGGAIAPTHSAQGAAPTFSAPPPVSLGWGA